MKLEELAKNDLPSCSFVKCRHNQEHSCTKPDEYEKCSRGRIFTLTENVYKKYPGDNDVWLLLQEIVRIGQRVNKIYDEFGLDDIKKSVADGHCNGNVEVEEGHC